MDVTAGREDGLISAEAVNADPAAVDADVGGGFASKRIIQHHPKPSGLHTDDKYTDQICLHQDYLPWTPEWIHALIPRHLRTLERPQWVRRRKMHFVVQPRREARPGDVLTPATTICVRASGTSTVDEGLGEDIDTYWAFVSIVSEDGMVALAPPSTTLLSGTLTDSIHKANLTGHEREVGHSSFQNLAINQRGNFRLRISLIHMSALASSMNTPSAVNIASVCSYVIRVDDNACDIF